MVINSSIKSPWEYAIDISLFVFSWRLMQQCFLRRIIYILFFCSAFAAQAKQEDYSVLEMPDSNFTQFTASRQQPDLFLHIDKTVYVPPGEYRWLAYTNSYLNHPQ